jgi:hypothetical protein
MALTRICSSPPSAKSYASTSTEQQVLSVSRITAYVNDPAQPHIQHRHISSQEAMQAHTTATGSYLEAFEAKMSQSEK